MRPLFDVGEEFVAIPADTMTTSPSPIYPAFSAVTSACLVYLAFTVDGVSWQLVRFISFFATAAFACYSTDHHHRTVNYIRISCRA